VATELPQHCDVEAHDRRQGSHATTQLDDFSAQIGLGHVEHVHGDHGSQFAAEPAGRRRSGNTPAGGDPEIAGPADKVTESVVVNLLTLSLSHARHLHRGHPGRNPVVGPQAPVSVPRRQPYR